MRLVISVLFAALATPSLSAQTAVGAPDTSAFRRLELPAPSAIRAGSGAPGPEYWQQRVDYVIRASLDTAARSLRGEERITYTNNSPDTLRYLWLQLDQNAFTPDGRGHRIFNQRQRYGAGASRRRPPPAGARPFPLRRSGTW